MSPWLFLALFFSVFISDAVYTLWLRCATTNRRWGASLAAAALPLIAGLQLVCIVEGTPDERVAILLVDAAASFLATWLVMTWFPSADAQG